MCSITVYGLAMMTNGYEIVAPPGYGEPDPVADYALTPVEKETGAYREPDAGPDIYSGSPVIFQEDTLDTLIQRGVLSEGAFNNCRVSPPVSVWAERHRALKTNLGEKRQ